MKTGHTFRHLLQQTEDRTAPDEVPGLKEVHGGREVCSRYLCRLHLEQKSIQLLLSISKHHPATCLHRDLQLRESCSLPGVWPRQTAAQAAQHHHGHEVALQVHRHGAVFVCASSRRETSNIILTHTQRTCKICKVTVP